MNFRIKNNCELIEKVQLNENVYFLKYRFDKDFLWIPGQYVGITINPTYRRSYSIMDYDGENLSFLVDVRPGGIASKYFENVKVGDSNQILGPYGKFTIQKNDLKKVFICTGTGVAPFIPMIKELINNGDECEIFFGTRFYKENFAQQYLQDFIGKGLNFNLCITREDISDFKDTDISIHHGRVREVIPKLNLNWQNSEFYICGNPEMVNDMEQVLKKHGVENILLERYS